MDITGPDEEFRLDARPSGDDLKKTYKRETAAIWGAIVQVKICLVLWFLVQNAQWQLVGTIILAELGLATTFLALAMGMDWHGKQGPGRE